MFTQAFVTEQDVYLNPDKFILPGIVVHTETSYREAFGVAPPAFDWNRAAKIWADKRPEILSSTRRTVLYDQAFVFGTDSGAPIMSGSEYVIDSLSLMRDEAINFNIPPERVPAGRAIPLGLPIPLKLPAGAIVIPAPGLNSGPSVVMPEMLAALKRQQLKGGASTDQIQQILEFAQKGLDLSGDIMKKVLALELLLKK